MKDDRPSIESIEDHGRSVAEQLSQLSTSLGDDDDRSRYSRLLERVRRQVQSDRERAWRGLVTSVAELFRSRGWAWNGVYDLVDDHLELVVAHGPPVCASIPHLGGVGTSGACFDSLLMNRTLVIPDATAWTGFVSCDPHSGLRTRGSLVVPIRRADGRPVGVWDMDSEGDVGLHDGLLMEAIVSHVSFATDGVLVRESP